MRKINMKPDFKIFYIVISLMLLSACTKTNIRIKDFDWIVELKKSRRESPYIMEKHGKNIILTDNKKRVQIDFNGIIKSDETDYQITKESPKIYFYSKTIGLPMLGNGRKSVVELIDTTLIAEVFFIDKIKVKAKLDRNDDEFYRYVEFRTKENNRLYKFEMSRYDDISNVYDVIQIDERRFAITFEKYKKNLESKYCIGIIDLIKLTK